MGAYVSGKKQEVSQKAIGGDITCGPLPGIILGLLSHFIGNKRTFIFLRNLPGFWYF
jgi:hypothetical protein